MLHQSAEQFQPPGSLYGSLQWDVGEDRREPFPYLIDAEAFIREIRRAGADLYPTRGPNSCFGEVDGRFGILTPLERLKDVADVEVRYAQIMKADPVAVGRVAEALFREKVVARAGQRINGDLAIARADLERLATAQIDSIAEANHRQEIYERALKEEHLEEDYGSSGRRLYDLKISTGHRAAAEACELAAEEYYGTEEYALSLPIRCERDALFKLLFTLENEVDPSDASNVLAEVQAFVGSESTAGFLQAAE